MPPLRTLSRPSPFFGESEFGFAVPAAGAAHLVIYDVAGRVVRELVSAELPAGEHTTRWDARDDRGAIVPAGI